MPSRIEDYAMVGDCRTAALVGRDGAVDWLCLPRFDSPACFASLLGTPDNGRWRIAPQSGASASRRHYRDGSVVLETIFETDDGAVRLIDFMPIGTPTPNLIRIVEGISGAVAMRSDLALRFDYGSVIPWVTASEGGLTATAGPDHVHLRADVPVHGEKFHTVAEFVVKPGDRVSFVMTWSFSFEPEPPPTDVEAALAETERYWGEWSAKCRYEGPWRDAVKRSLVTLKAMTYLPTGGIVAAITTSLPEQLGGVRNWDYRYCWVRDATFTLYALVNAGYLDEARAWRVWLHRSVAGTPETLQIMYGIDGRRRLMEWEIPWLPGYEDASPVRVGNGAASQFQLDVFGELAATMYVCRQKGLEANPEGWEVAKALYVSLEERWREPDDGIWEVRGPRRHFTHSKVMAWLAFDRAIRAIEEYGVDGPVDRWRACRDEIHAEVCREGFNSDRNSFVQSYGGTTLDASLLMIPLVGFLPAEDPRVAGTIDAIRRDLARDGLIARYETEESVDGLPPGEGAFLPCTFWLVDCLFLQGKRDEAFAMFDHLVNLANDVGLMSEEYDAVAERMTGNFPQAFSHVSLVNTAFLLSGQRKPLHETVTA